MAKRRKKRRKTSRKSGGGRLGAMLVGLVAGLAISATAWWLLRPPAQGPAPVASDTEDPPPGEPKRRAEPVEIEPSGQGFDFYERLPEQEVVISDDFRERRAPRAPLKTVTEPGRYEIQAGSFRMAEGAEETKARLGMLGMRARVVPLQTASGTLHQVRVGPIDVDTLNEYRRRLAAADIKVMVLKAED